jgi:hypothetical protein
MLLFFFFLSFALLFLPRIATAFMVWMDAVLSDKHALDQKGQWGVGVVG